MRLWDLTSPQCAALLRLENVATTPLVAFDPDGMRFALATAPFVRIYAMNQLSTGPVAEFNLDESIRSISVHKAQGRFNPSFVGLSYDPTGTYLLISTNQGMAFVFDAINGRMHSVVGEFDLSATPSTSTRASDACFSPDSQFVLRGMSDGSIKCWKRETAVLVKTWKGMHHSAVRCLKFNPTMLNFASACNNLNLWLPKLDGVGTQK